MSKRIISFNLNTILLILKFGAYNLSDITKWGRINKNFYEIVHQYVPDLWVKLCDNLSIRRIFKLPSYCIAENLLMSFDFMRLRLGTIPKEHYDNMESHLLEKFLCNNDRNEYDERKIDELFIRFGYIDTKIENTNALEGSCIEQNYKRALRLLENNANVNISNNLLETIIIMETSPKLKFLPTELFWKVISIVISKSTKNNITDCLKYCSKNSSICKYLIDCGADVNFVYHNRRDSLFSICILEQEFDTSGVLNILLENGLNPNTQPFSPFIRALQCRKINIRNVLLLLEFGCNVYKIGTLEPNEILFTKLDTTHEFNLGKYRQIFYLINSRYSFVEEFGDFIKGKNDYFLSSVRHIDILLLMIDIFKTNGLNFLTRRKELLFRAHRYKSDDCVDYLSKS